jgi:hypothetical protein
MFRKELLPKLLFGLTFGDNVNVLVSVGDVITDLDVLTIRINLNSSYIFPRAQVTSALLLNTCALHSVRTFILHVFIHHR